MGILSRGLWGMVFSFRILGIEKAANGVLAALYPGVIALAFKFPLIIKTVCYPIKK